MRTAISGARYLANARAYVAPKVPVRSATRAKSASVARACSPIARRAAQELQAQQAFGEEAVVDDGTVFYRELSEAFRRREAIVKSAAGRAEVFDRGLRDGLRSREKSLFAGDLVRVEQRAAVGDVIAEQPAYLRRAAGNEDVV